MRIINVEVKIIEQKFSVVNYSEIKIFIYIKFDNLIKQFFCPESN